MGFLSTRRERKRAEDLRAAYPEEWIMAESLANFQFRDLVYCGMEAYSTLQERQDLADGTASEAQQRFFEMKQINPESTDPIAMQVFHRAFKLRLIGLLDEYAHSASSDQAEFFATAVAGSMNPGSAAALTLEAERARKEDDMSGGPLVVRTNGAKVAVLQMKAGGASEEATDEELARTFPTQMQEILRRDVFIGTLDVRDAIAILPSGRPAFEQASAAREARLRGGPLLPN